MIDSYSLMFKFENNPRKVLARWIIQLGVEVERSVGGAKGWGDPYKSTDSCHPTPKPTTARFLSKINKQIQLLHRADCAVFDKSSCSSSLQLQPIFTAVSDIMIALLYFTALDLYRLVWHHAFPYHCIYSPLQGLSIFRFKNPFAFETVPGFKSNILSNYRTHSNWRQVLDNAIRQWSPIQS